MTTIGPVTPFFPSLRTNVYATPAPNPPSAPAKEISVYDYTQVIFAAIWGFIIFGQRPDIFSVIGYVIIIGAAVYRSGILSRWKNQKEVQ